MQQEYNEMQQEYNVRHRRADCNEWYIPTVRRCLSV
jgi:hypothetical protein